MVTKKIGISRDLIIHPGETLADILEERNITQLELAESTGVSAAFINKVIGGSKGISAKFAFALEYSLDIPKSFWINLQANYDAELLEFEKMNTITEEERYARNILRDIVKFLRQQNRMPSNEKTDDSIISLRKALRVGNVANVKNMVPEGAFRLSEAAKVDPYVLGAWIRLCQIAGENIKLNNVFSKENVNQLVRDIKHVMLSRNTDIQNELKCIFSNYGIDFSIMKNFKGAPVHGYVAPKNEGTYQMIVTIRNSYADIFWFSLFHELGHIVNGDVSKSSKFVDVASDTKKENAADKFAMNALLSDVDYKLFVNEHDYSIESIKRFADMQHVMPYIVIGRLQKEKLLDYNQFSDQKLRYKWAEN